MSLGTWLLMVNKSSFLQCCLTGRLVGIRSLFFKAMLINYPKQQCKHSIKKSSVSLACCEKSNKQSERNKKFAKPNQKHLTRDLFGGNLIHLPIPRKKFWLSCLQSFVQTVLGVQLTFSIWFCLVLPLWFALGREDTTHMLSPDGWRTLRRIY